MQAGDITYHLDMGQMNAFKAHLRDFNKNGDIESWYNSLTRDEKKLVFRTGIEDVPEQYNDGDFIEN